MSVNFDAARRRIPTLAGVAGPVLVVLAMRFLSGAGPAAAPAAQPEIDGAFLNPDAPVRAEPALTDRQKQALQWVASLGSDVPERSPMDQRSQHEPGQSPEPGAERPEADPPTPEFSLRAVLGGSERLAAINGRVYREGDEVLPGWRLTRIKADIQIVEIAGPGGRTVRIGLSH